MSDTVLRRAKVEVTVLQHLESCNTSQRRSLFLDEVIDVQLLLHTATNKDSIRAQLSKLSVVLEAHAIGSVQQEGEVPTSKQIRDLVSTCVLDASSGLIEGTSSDQTQVSWTTKVHIDRTRINSYMSTLTMTANLTLALPTTSIKLESDTVDEYLTPGVPTSSANLLISLAQSPAFANTPNPPSLPASRLLQTAPSRPRSIKPPPLPQSVRGSSMPLNLLPALTSKLRTFGIGNPARVLANLEVAVSRHVQKATVSDVIVELEHGKALPQGPQSEDRSPRTLRGGDVASLVYDMQPSQRHGEGNDVVERVTTDPGFHRVRMSLTASVTTFDTAHLVVDIVSKWQTPIDLASLLQPTTRDSTTGAESGPGLSTLITLTTSRHPAMPHPTPKGSTIHWQVLIANRSTTRTLKLVIVPVIPGANPIAPRDFSGKGQHTLASNASADISSNLPAWLYASTETHSALASVSLEIPSPHPSLLTLTPLIQVGALPPGTSTTAEAVFLVLSGSNCAGAVEALRVIDLESRPKDGKGRWSWADVKSDILPDVVISEASSSTRSPPESQKAAMMQAIEVV